MPPFNVTPRESFLSISIPGEMIPRGDSGGGDKSPKHAHNGQKKEMRLKCSRSGCPNTTSTDTSSPTSAVTGSPGSSSDVTADGTRSSTLPSATDTTKQSDGAHTTVSDTPMTSSNPYPIALPTFSSTPTPAFATSTPSSSSSPSSVNSTPASQSAISHSKVNAGAIAGGVIGGVLLLALVALGIFFVRRSRRNHTAPSAEFMSANPSHAPFQRMATVNALSSSDDPPPAFTQGSYSYPVYEKFPIPRR